MLRILLLPWCWLGRASKTTRRPWPCASSCTTIGRLCPEPRRFEFDSTRLAVEPHAHFASRVPAAMRLQVRDFLGASTAMRARRAPTRRAAMVHRTNKQRPAAAARPS